MITYNNAELKETYRFVHSSYVGNYGFQDGSYLAEHGREYDYETRKSMASYLNLVRPTVDSQVSPVFAERAMRVHNGGELIDMFIKDCDNNNTPIQDFIEDITTMTVLLGNSFIVVDNFADTPESLGEALEERKFPYIYSKELSDVFDYEVDVFNRLQRISFTYGVFNDGSDTGTTLYKRFTKDDVQYFIRKQEDNENGDGYVWKEHVISETTHGLGRVPVVYNDKSIFTFPPFYSLATIARAIYNSNSRIEALESTQAFSILLLPSINLGAESQDIVLSKDNALFFDTQANHIPSFISPDSSNMTVLADNRNYVIEMFLKSADILGSTAISTSSNTASGVSMSYSFYGKQMKLKENSNIATYLEEQVIELVGLYLGTNIEYSVEYPNNFAPTMVEVQTKLDLLIRVADLQISDTVGTQMYSEIISLVGEFMDMESEDVKRMMDSAGEYSQVLTGNEDEEQDKVSETN